MKKLFNTIYYLARDAKQQSGSNAHAWSAVWRFVICQIKFLFGNKDFIYKWDDDITIRVIQGEHGTTECYYLGLYDYLEMSMLKKLVHQGDVFFDIGANVGTWSLLAAKNGGNAYAFEPVKKTFDIMSSMVELNPDLRNRIVCENAAVGDVDGMVCITTDEESTTNHVVENTQGSESTQMVRQIAIDEYAKNMHIKMAKIDVEGYEVQALNGMKTMLREGKVDVIVLEDFDGKNSKSYQLLRSYGFKRCSYDLNRNMIVEDDQFTGNGNNSIYVRNLEEINEQLSTAAIVQ